MTVLWGPNARFAEVDFSLSELRGKWATKMLQMLTDNTVFSRFCATHPSMRLLEASPYGVMVRTTFDLGYGSEWSSTHPGKYIQVMAELEVPSTRPIHVSDDKPECSIADVVSDEARRVHLSVELEWTAIGLGRYLDSPQWTNRFSQAISFSDIALRLATQRLGTGACFGCHVPYALATLLAVDRQTEFLSPKAARIVASRLRSYSEGLAKTQRDDGSWGSNWPNACGEPSYQPSFTWGAPELDGLCATGHHLEWMTITPPELRPSAQILERAARFLIPLIGLTKAQFQEDWHIYMPVSHAAKAVFGIAGCPFGTST